jgi:crossover junction endodeoxyribonuclease RusA
MSPETPNGPILSFDVRGIPESQGSMRAFVAGGRAHVVHGNPRSLLTWRADIAAVAREVIGVDPLIVGPVQVQLHFRMPRIQAHYTPKGVLRPSAPIYVSTTPDLDKLIRAALDALTGVAFMDDKQVCKLVASKHYAGLEGPGVHVLVAHVQRQLA